eukprot:543738_1
MKQMMNSFKKMSNTKKVLIGVAVVGGAFSAITFYRYSRKTRTVLHDDLIPDDDRKAAIPVQDFAINAAQYAGLVEKMIGNLYDYAIRLSLTKDLIPHLNEIRSANDSNLSLKCVDAGCSVGGLSFRLSQQKDVNKIYGIDLSPSFIDFAKKRVKKEIPINGLKKEIKDEHLDKITFLCQDASMLQQFQNNEIDIGFVSMVLHEMPHRVPMNILSELSRVCQYVVVLDWTGNFPWNKSGIRNRFIEFLAGPQHFAGFKHFVALGGIEEHVKSLKKYRKGIKIRKYKLIDKGTIGFYVLDTSNVGLDS